MERQISLYKWFDEENFKAFPFFRVEMAILRLKNMSCSVVAVEVKYPRQRLKIILFSGSELIFSQNLFCICICELDKFNLDKYVCTSGLSKRISMLFPY